MNLSDITTKGWILALFIRDDGERFLLGDGWYDFKDSLQHFQPNTIANDIVELQGTDGQLLAGQVRRSTAQRFNGYIGDSTVTKTEIETRRMAFLQFFQVRRSYDVIYIFPDGSSIKRERGYLVEAPSVPEMWQFYPEYSVALNFENVNYYEYAEDDDGKEIFAHSALVAISNSLKGGLIWDNNGAYSEELNWSGYETEAGDYIVLNDVIAGAPMSLTQLDGNATQTTYSGKNIFATSDSIWTGQSAGRVTYSATNDDFTFSRPAGADFLVANGSLALKPSTTYSIMFDVSQNTMTDSFRLVTSSSCIQSSTLNIAAGTTGKVYGKLITMSSLTQTYDIWFYCNSPGNTLKAKIMLVEGDYTSATFPAYEPFTNGPAPNPDYPQEVKTVTGEQTIQIVPEQTNIANPRTFIDWTKRTYDLCEEYGWGNTSNRPMYGAFQGRSHVVRYNADTLYTKRDVMINPTYLEALNIYEGIFEAGKQYTFSMDIYPTATVGASNLVIRYTDNGTTSIPTGTQNQWTNVQITSTAGKTIKSLQLSYYSSQTYVDLDTLQIEEGTQKTDCPFISQDYDINLGKNLCYDITISGTTLILYYFDKNSVSAGTYTISTILADDVSSNTVSLVVDGNGIANLATITGTAGTTVSATFALTDVLISQIKQSASYCAIRIYKSGAQFALPTVGQIERSPFMTSYAPFMRTSKNLWNNGSLVTGYLNSTGGITVGGGNDRTTDYFIEVEPNTDYTISANILGSYAYLKIGEFASDESFIQLNTAASNSKSYTITTSATTKYIKASAYFGTYTPLVQLERSSTATFYESYNAQIELNELGDKQDSIWNDNGTWKLHKETAKIVLTGGELWSSYTTNTSIPAWNCDIFGCYLAPQTSTVFDGKSDYYLAKSQGSLYSLDVNGVSYRVNRAAILIKNLSVSTLSDFQTWLSTHPTTVYYALETPTDTEITDENLLAQLNTISELYGGQNNIMLVPSAGAQGTMTIQYATELLPGGGYVWQEGDTGGVTNVDVIGVANAQPIWTVTGPAVDPTLTNITTGQAITWTGTVPNGQTLVIDMGKQTAELNGANVYSGISGDWIDLQIGQNKLTYSATGGDIPPSKIEWNGVVG